METILDTIRKQERARTMGDFINYVMSFAYGPGASPHGREHYVKALAIAEDFIDREGLR